MVSKRKYLQTQKEYFKLVQLSWMEINVQGNKSKKNKTLIFGQDISDISGYLGVESFTSHTCDDSQMYKVCSSLNLKPDQLLICILHVYNSFVAVSVNHYLPPADPH